MLLSVSLLSLLLVGAVVADVCIGSKHISWSSFSERILALVLLVLDISIFSLSASVSEEEIWLPL